MHTVEFWEAKWVALFNAPDWKAHHNEHEKAFILHKAREAGWDGR